MVTIDWSTSAAALRFLADDDGPVRLVDLASDRSRLAGPYRRARQPLVEVLTPEHGMHSSSHSGRHTGTRLGLALRYVRHAQTTGDAADQLVIEQSDPATGLTCVSTFVALPGVAAVRTTTTVSLAPDRPRLTLWAVTSFATGAGISADPNALDVWCGRSGWAAEHRWTRQPLRSAGLVATDPGARGETCRSAVSACSTSTWSSGTVVPAGAVQDRDTGATLAWQVEHNGGWLWEVGELPAFSRTVDDLPVGSDEAAGPPADDRTDDAPTWPSSGLPTRCTSGRMSSRRSGPSRPSR